MNENIELMMPIKAAPYDHQKKAFAFAMRVFGIFKEGGDYDVRRDSCLRPLREEFSKGSDRDA